MTDRFNLSVYVPHISKSDFNREASSFLAEYCPEALKTPMVIPIEQIAIDKLKLRIIEERLSEDLSILGQMCFTRGRVEIYNKAEDEYREIVVDAGTMLIDPDVIAKRGIGAKRNTVAHECVHWTKHRRYHIQASLVGGDGIAHRCPTVILPRIKNEDVRALVRNCVRAADKLARSGQIESKDKRYYVEKTLYLYGIKITAKIDAIIESEVTDLDIEQGDISTSEK